MVENGRDVLGPGRKLRQKRIHPHDGVKLSDVAEQLEARGIGRLRIGGERLSVGVEAGQIPRDGPKARVLKGAPGHEGCH